MDEAGNPDTSPADAPRLDGFAGAAETVLDLLADATTWGWWVLSRRDGARHVVLGLRGSDRSVGAKAVDLAWAETICSQLPLGSDVAFVGDLRGTATDTSAVEGILGPVRSYLGVPIYLEDGALFGTLCALDAEPRATDDAELQLVRAFSDVLGRLLFAELRLDAAARRAERAEHEAGGDPLTGVGNRRTWDRAVAAEEARCRRYGHLAAVLAIDVDHLKVVNDRDGHAAGDALLRRCAQVLAKSARGYDVVARVGGDEFCVLIPNGGLASATRAMERVERALADEGVAASVGMAVRPHLGSLVDARADADADMYRRRAFRRAAELLGADAELDDAGSAFETSRFVPPPTPTPTPTPSPLDRIIGRRPNEGLHDLAGGPDDRIGRLLEQARQHLGADVAFVGRVEHGRRLMEFVSAPPDLKASLQGRSDPLDETVCGRILEERAPEAIEDIATQPGTADLERLISFGVGGHVGVPLVLPDGRLYGTVCAALFRPDPSINPRDAEVLRVIAGVVADELAREELASEQRRARVTAIDAVIEVGGPVLVIQPIVDLTTGRHAGYEALARFPRSPWTGPAAWFAEAAEAGLDGELELLVLRRARGLLRHLPADRFLTVNLTPAALVSPHLQRELLDGPVDRMVIELTEQADPHPNGLADAMRVVRSGGLRVAVDDAGSGYSSLSRLLELRPDFVKLDLTLVRGIADDPARQALVSSLMEVTARLRTTLIAEGVEQQAEVDTLRDLGVRYAQGYRLGHPGPWRDVLCDEPT